MTARKIYNSTEHRMWYDPRLDCLVLAVLNRFGMKKEMSQLQRMKLSMDAFAVFQTLYDSHKNKQLNLCSKEWCLEG